MRALAPDGNCKTFDSRADGFARGEGLGGVVVEREAACDGGALAVLDGVSTNHDGRAALITAPNGTAQQRVLRAALGERATRPEDVSCLECHGTGTALGDPIETGAQRAVYGKSHPENQPLILGAVKSNLGHLEGSAGVAGVSKVREGIWQFLRVVLWAVCCLVVLGTAAQCCLMQMVSCVAVWVRSIMLQFRHLCPHSDMHLSKTNATPARGSLKTSRRPKINASTVTPLTLRQRELA